MHSTLCCPACSRYDGIQSLRPLIVFSLQNDVPTVSAAMPSAKAGNARASNMVQSDPIAERKQNFAANLAEVPELAALGKVYSSSEPQKLTEEETEYM